MDAQRIRILKMKDEGRIVFRENKGEWVVEYKLYLNESKGRVPLSLLTKTEKNSKGRSQLLEHINKSGVFSHPKPVGLIKDLLEFSTDRDSIVLDFFAGTCTTAEAVTTLNIEDDGDRQFIMVQLPEPTPEKSAAREAGYKTIADIGKHRVHSVCKNVDLGFRVFKLSASNYQPESDIQTDDLQIRMQELEQTLDPLRDGWSVENVLYEIVLKEGYPLNSKIETVKDLTANTIFRIIVPDETKSFYVCLDGELIEADLKRLDLLKDTIFVCRDVALNDTLAANLALQCYLKTI